MVLRRIACVAACALCLPGPLSGQARSEPGETGWFPSSFVVQPVAGARSGVDVSTGPLYVERERPAGTGKVTPEADVSFGYRVPVYRFADAGTDGLALDVGLEAGIVARFALGEGHNGLVNSDFRVAFPFGADFGDWEAQIAPVHVSSHLGDDYLDQTPEFDPGTSSRNGVEADVMYRIDPRLRLIGGVDYNWAAVGVETVGGHLGAAYDPPPTGDGFRPLGSVELRATDYAAGLAVTGSVGLGLRTGSGDLRFGLTGHAGPSDMGQFRRFDERYVGVFIGFVPSIVGRSGDGEG